jgi:hypothetical protein
MSNVAARGWLGRQLRDFCCPAATLRDGSIDGDEFLLMPWRSKGLADVGAFA